MNTFVLWNSYQSGIQAAKFIEQRNNLPAIRHATLRTIILQPQTSETSLQLNQKDENDIS